MADRITPENRSLNMSKIKSKNTFIELIVRKFLFSKGFRFRLHDNKLHGRPDVILKKYNTVIFINGCFWHGHPNCKLATIPKTKTEFWKSKIENTKNRDVLNYKKLTDLKWNVITIWECELKDNKNEILEEVCRKIKLEFIK